VIHKNKSALGFTLIELLVVIAILGILAGSILVAVNPIEQLRKGRDAGRKTTVNQLGRAIESYYTSQNGTYPVADNDWMTTLQTAGELKALPSPIEPPCENSAAVQTDIGYCYEENGTKAIVYVPAESTAERIRSNCPEGDSVWIVWSSTAGKTGTVCTPGKTNSYPSIDIEDLQ